MREREMDPVSSLVGYLHETTPRQAVKLARELCGQLEGEPDSFHGGVWPGNVTLDLEGAALLGRPLNLSVRERSATQAEYTAPEFFWSGERSAAADVYTVGLMLYAGCAGGRLPFQPLDREPSPQDRADAMRRRMKGEPVAAPSGISPELKRVIEKALAYEPEDRYITAREMLTALNGTEEARQDPKLAAAANSAAMAGAAEILFAPQEPEPDLAHILDDIDLDDILADTAEEPAPAEPAEELVPEEPIPEEIIPEGPVPEEIPPEETAPEEADFDVSAPEGHIPAEDVPAEQHSAEPILAEAVSPPEPLPEADAGWQKEAAPAAAAAAAIPQAEGVMDAPPQPAPPQADTPRPEYRVQKHFEKTAPARAKKKKKRRSPAPFLWGAAALAILAGAGYLILGTGGSGQELSAPFPTQSAAADSRQPGSSPTVIVPQPDRTEAPEDTPLPDETPPVQDSPLPQNTLAPETAFAPAVQPSPVIPAVPTAPLGGGTGSAGGYIGGTGSSAGSSYTVTPADDTVYITGVGVNVRSGPGTGYPIIGTVSTGDALRRTGISGSWSQVQFKSVTGFVSNAYATAQAPATAVPAPTEEPAPSPGPVYTVTVEDLTYAQAKEAAEAHGGLAVVRTGEELAALTEALDEAVDYVWLGLEYDAEAGWQWADGTAIAGDDPLWAQSPAPDQDGALLARTEDGWRLMPLRLADFDPADEAYVGRLAYAAAG